MQVKEAPPSSQQRLLSQKYIVYRFLSNLWFLSAIWLYFYRIFITDQQVGLLDAAAFAIGLIAEVPSGALADKFGRDKMVRIGQLVSGGGLLIQAFGSSIFPFFFGQAILMIGISLVSGADDALFFDKLKFSEESWRWRKLITRGGQAALIGTLGATILGGWAYTYNPRLPWILTGLAFICSIVAISGVRDTRPIHARQKIGPELRSYLHDIRTGFAQFRLPKLWLYVPLIISVQGLFYAAGFGILRIILLDRFGFSPFHGSLIVAGSGAITVLILGLMHKYAHRLSERYVLGVIAAATTLVLLLSAGGIGYWGIVVIFVLYASEYTLQPFMSEILNASAPVNQRATVLSVASFLRTLPYVILAPIIGALNTHGTLQYFLITWSMLVLASLFVYLLKKNRDRQISVADT